jgi:hypothetical protein
MFGFACKYEEGGINASAETPEVKFVPRSEVFNYITSPALIERFKAFLEFDGNIRYLAYTTRPEYELKDKRNF